MLHSTKPHELPRTPFSRTSENMMYANFYEKAHFVKADVAAAMWRERQLLSALRAMLLFALR